MIFLRGSGLPHRFDSFCALIMSYCLKITSFLFTDLCKSVKFQDDSYAKENRLCAKNVIFAEVIDMFEFLKSESLKIDF